MPLCRSALLLVLCSLPTFAMAQATPLATPDIRDLYERILSQVDKIPAFDHHAHPGFADDPDVDAMATPPNASAALRSRPHNPAYHWYPRSSQKPPLPRAMWARRSTASMWFTYLACL